MRVSEGVAAVSRYSKRLHGLAGDRHHVASPLGAWMLLALGATLGAGDVRQALEEVLGSDAVEAAQLTAQLLANPHPLIGRAIGLWDQTGADNGAFRAWKEALPAEVERGPVPTQGALDRWAQQHTWGLIQKFPIDINPLTILLMASALATRVTWRMPFDTVPAIELGSMSPWSTRLQQVLRTPEWDRQTQFIADTDSAGRVAVHIIDADKGLRVVSVVADEDVAASDVIAAAHRIATGVTGWWEPSGYTVCSLYDLPLGEEPRWVIAEEPAFTAYGQEENYWTTIPAWSGVTTLNLTARDETGFALVARALSGAIDTSATGLDSDEGLPLVAQQSTSVRFHATGFEAASVTAMAIALGEIPTKRWGTRRTAHLRFGQPFAVVAVTQAPFGATSFWHGMPVFSAWVVDPEEPGTASRN